MPGREWLPQAPPGRSGNSPWSPWFLWLVLVFLLDCSPVRIAVRTLVAVYRTKPHLPVRIPRRHAHHSGPAPPCRADPAHAAPPGHSCRSPARSAQACPVPRGYEACPQVLQHVAGHGVEVPFGLPPPFLAGSGIIDGSRHESAMAWWKSGSYVTSKPGHVS